MPFLGHELGKHPNIWSWLCGRSTCAFLALWAPTHSSFPVAVMTNDGHCQKKTMVKSAERGKLGQQL